MIYALTTVLFVSPALAAAAAAVALVHLERTLRGLRIPLTSDF